MGANPSNPATDPLAELIKGAQGITFGCLCTLGADHAEPVEGEPAVVEFERAVRAEATYRYRRPRMLVGTASDREEATFVEGAMWAPALPSRQVVAEAIDPVAYSASSGAHDPRARSSSAPPPPPTAPSCPRRCAQCLTCTTSSRAGVSLRRVDRSVSTRFGTPLWSWSMSDPHLGTLGFTRPFPSTRSQKASLFTAER